MKNLSLVLNVVLLVAVAVLFYLHFSGKDSDSNKTSVEAISKDTSEAAAPVALPEIRNVNGPIAYINLDSLQEKYEFYKKGQRDLETAYNRKANEFKAKEKELQDEYVAYQQLAPQLDEKTREIRETNIMKKQQDLVQLQKTLTDDLTASEERFNKEYLKKIDDYLRRLSKDKNYSYVFTYSKGGPAHIVFANDSLEITRQVIQGLNQDYRKGK